MAPSIHHPPHRQQARCFFLRHNERGSMIAQNALSLLRNLQTEVRQNPLLLQRFWD
jgi:hypothetical protein